MKKVKINTSGDVTVNGLTAYDAIKMQDAPIKSLPKARSMTQARIDYRQAEETLIPFLIEREKIAN